MRRMFFSFCGCGAVWKNKAKIRVHGSWFRVQRLIAKLKKQSQNEVHGSWFRVQRLIAKLKKQSQFCAGQNGHKCLHKRRLWQKNRLAEQIKQSQSKPIAPASKMVPNGAEQFLDNLLISEGQREREHFRPDISVTFDTLPAFLGLRAAFMNEDNDNIQQLLSEARSGDQTSLGRLASIVRGRLYSFVFRTTLDHDLTEDVLQETLLTMVDQVCRLRDKDRFWPWVFRIAYNKLQDSLRLRRHQSTKKALLQQNQCETKASNGGILEATIHAERLQRLSALIEQLSRPHRDILRLRYYEQLPYTKIAALTRTTPQRARARFHRAKKHLKARMKDDTQQGISVVV